MLTTANAILGQGQLSLAKYLLIVAREDCPALDIHNVDDFLRHLLERVDWQRDLHFQTCTTIDTLDYSGSGLNQGSKVVIAAVGPARRTLPTEVGTLDLPEGFARIHGCACPACWRSKGRLIGTPTEATAAIERFCAGFSAARSDQSVPARRDRRRQRIHGATR